MGGQVSPDLSHYTVPLLGLKRLCRIPVISPRTLGRGAIPLISSWPSSILHLARRVGQGLEAVWGTSGQIPVAVDLFEAFPFAFRD